MFLLLFYSILSSVEALLGCGGPLTSLLGLAGGYGGGYGGYGTYGGYGGYG